MATDTRDEVQAQSFTSRRVRAALLEGDAESDARPLSRLGAGAYGGIFVTILLLAVAGIYGVLRPGGSTAWQEPGAFIVERETGARYVYLDGALRPMLNYSSARLLLGDRLHVVTVSVRSLDSVPHGSTLGIPLAPDSLPDAEHIVGTDWSVCTIGRAASDDRLRTAILPGVVAAGDPVGVDAGYLVRSAAGGTYLIWSAHAYPIADKWLAAMGYDGAGALPVDESFIAALPIGQPVAPLTIDGLGEPGPPLPGSVQPVAVGTVFADRMNNSYVMTRQGLAALTPLQAQLLLADPAVAQAYSVSNPTPLKVSQAQVSDAALVPLPDQRPGEAPPRSAPEIASLSPGEQQLCMRFHAQIAQVVVGPADRRASAASGPVQLPTGSGALIASRPDPWSQGSTAYLVTDTGMRYPVSGQRTLELLGLSSKTVARLPGGLVNLLPLGPALDPAAAAAPAS